MREVDASNKQSLLLKEQKALEDKNLDASVAQFQKNKASKEEAKATEKRIAQAEKEAEIQKLRELQERADDRQGEIDALRAKRAFEQNERDHRTKERTAEEKRKRVVKELEAARRK